VSAGGALVRDQDGHRDVLVIRGRGAGYDLPRGPIEWDELPSEAAGRQTREAAGVESAVVVGGELGHADHVGAGGGHLERVRYFGVGCAAPVHLGALPARTAERRWLRQDELDTVPLVDEVLRPIVRAALGR
jgi:ADP-ribose pyrophosphatase YjhB (NUDIX family)